MQYKRVLGRARRVGPRSGHRGRTILNRLVAWLGMVVIVVKQVKLVKRFELWGCEAVISLI
jgi:hypothetical protein